MAPVNTYREPEMESARMAAELATSSAPSSAGTSSGLSGVGMANAIGGAVSNVMGLLGSIWQMKYQERIAELQEQLADFKMAKAEEVQDFQFKQAKDAQTSVYTAETAKLELAGELSTLHKELEIKKQPLYAETTVESANEALAARNALQQRFYGEPVA
ncbi:MAG: hypothetical protein HY696_07680 [Deltaproteobacteria bacterium]|nr:hypothetical protein [Deltaproteobacteria bacterium]